MGSDRVVARRGKTTYLVAVDGDGGVVVDEKTQERFPPFPIQSILARGYWDDIKHDDKLLERLIGVPEIQKQEETE